MTLDDLKNYEVIIREPVNITYKGYQLHSTGVPSGGGVALSILKVMEGYNITDLNDIQEMALNTHRFDESMRYAYAARNELGDPDFFNYMNGLEAEMLKSETAAKTRAKILDDRTKNVTEYRPRPDSKQYFLPDTHGTSHIVASDASGLSITSTSTVNLLFGSQLIVPETGKHLSLSEWP